MARSKRQTQRNSAYDLEQVATVHAYDLGSVRAAIEYMAAHLPSTALMAGCTEAEALVWCDSMLSKVR